MSLGSRIKAARQASGFSQKALGEKIGVKQTSVANYETESSTPNIDTLIALMRELGVDANFLFADSFEQTKKPAAENSDGRREKTAEILNRVSKMSQKNIESLEAFIGFLESLEK